MYLDVCERDTSRYKQDTCKIHHDTTGYVSDRKSPPKTIGNPPSPGETHRGRRIYTVFPTGESCELRTVVGAPIHNEKRGLGFQSSRARVQTVVSCFCRSWGLGVQPSVHVHVKLQSRQDAQPPVLWRHTVEGADKGSGGARGCERPRGERVAR